jgi:xylulose-5-phosphate/fructose-6-phosphate phosphoketolase
VPRLRNSGAHVKGWLQDQILEHVAYAREHGIHKPEIQDWTWPQA